MFNKVVGNPGFIITNTGQILEGLGVVLQDVGTHFLGRGQHGRHTAVDVVCSKDFKIKLISVMINFPILLGESNQTKAG